MSIEFEKPKQPSKKQAKAYKAWVKYLSDSRLSGAEIKKRAGDYTTQGLKPKT